MMALTASIFFIEDDRMQTLLAVFVSPFSRISFVVFCHCYIIPGLYKLHICPGMKIIALAM